MSGVSQVSQVSPGSRVAVTGVNGFVGRHLVRELRAAGSAVVGIGMEDESPLADLLEHYVACDLTQVWPEIGPVDAIVHLAGLSSVAPSFADPQRYLHTSGAMATRMLEPLLDSRARTRVLMVSSGAVYAADQAHPITESGRIAATSPYVVGKLLVEHQADYYASRGVDVVVVRPFNHIGPGQAEGFLLPDLVAEAGRASSEDRPMNVGDLGTRRDYTDVRDVVRAYRLLLSADLDDTFGERIFNVCSGKPRSGDELRVAVLARLGLDATTAVVEESRLRPSDPASILGSAERLRKVTGWVPEISLEQTVGDVVDAVGTAAS